MDPKRLVIIDGYSLLFRAFYGTRYLSTSDGRPTNALYGLVGMLFYVLEKQRPQAMLVALDAPGKTFRHAEFAEYKGTRRDTPDELKAQFPVARDLMAALGIPSIELTGFEADDIVGTVSRKAEENGYHTTIITGDLDALQLVDPCVSVMTPKVGVTDVAVYGVAEVMERMHAAGLSDVPVVVGGIIPEEDAVALRAMGVAAVYTPKDFELNRIMMDIVGLVEARPVAAE